MAERTLLVCAGSHCRKALRKGDRLQESVSRLPVKVTRVGCQKVCRGPVVGLVVDGRYQWFERMDSRKAIAALEDLLQGDTLGKPLEKRRSRKRAGKRRA